MSQFPPAIRVITLALATALWIPAVLSAQTTGFGRLGDLTYQAAAPAAAAAVRRLSIDDAVKLALEQNLGIQIQRIDPQIQDVGIAQARSFWAPSLNSSLFRNSQDRKSTRLNSSHRL